MYVNNSVPVIDAPVLGAPGNDAPYMGIVEKGPRVAAPYNPIIGLHVVNRDDLRPTAFTDDELNTVYAELASDRHGYDMLTESAEFEEVDDYYNPGDEVVPAEDIYEAIVIDKFSRAEHRMNAVVRTLNKYLAGKSIQALPAIVGQPKKAGSFAYVTVQLPFSDGQTVSAIFHSPDGDKKKIAPSDTIIAFRWLLNRRDITHVLAPEDGSEISLESIGKRLTQLVEKNSARFEKTQKDAAGERKELDDTRQAVKDAEAQQGVLMDSIATAKTDADTVDAKLSNTLTLLEKQKTINAELRATLDGLQKSGANRKDGDNMQGKNGSNDTNTGKEESSAEVKNQIGAISEDDKKRLNLPSSGPVILRAGDMEEIDRKHKDDFAAYGFSGAKEFVDYILANIEHAYKAGGKAYSLTRSINEQKRGWLVAELEYNEENGYYRITTATVAREGYFKKKTPLSETAQTDHSKDGTPSATWGESGVDEEKVTTPKEEVKGADTDIISTLPGYMHPVYSLAQGITDGLIDDLAEVGRVLDNAAEEAEKDGRFDEFEDMFNKAADTLTELLKKKQGAM